MKRIFSVVFIVMAIYTFSPLHLGNAYLRTSRFDTVVVSHGENVWSIAERYTKSSSDTSSLVEAIIDVNGLDNEANIHTGQSIKIPVVIH